MHISSINEEKQEPLSLVNTSRRFCIFSVAFSNDGKEILGGSNDGDLYIFDRELNHRTLKVSFRKNIFFFINSSLTADLRSRLRCE